MSVKARARYTLKFKLEAVRLVKAGQSLATTAKVLGIVEPPVLIQIHPK
jgi:transposase